MSLIIEQKTGPVLSNSSWFIKSASSSSLPRIVKKIAIQFPYNQIFPIKGKNAAEQDLSPDLSIKIGDKNENYRLSPNNILEFSDLNISEAVEIIALKELPKEALLDVLIEEL